MLGRLEMSVQECIEAYCTFSEAVFQQKFLHNKSRINILGRVQGRFDAGQLEAAIKSILLGRGMAPDALLHDPNAKCKV